MLPAAMADSLATIWRDLLRFTRAGSARRSIKARGQRQGMEIEMATATAVVAPAAVAAPAKKAPRQLPAPNSDFFQFADMLGDE